MSTTPASTGVLAIVKQACRGLAGCAIVVASLVVFPSAIPWLAAAWLVAYTASIVLGRLRLAMLSLGACAAILVAKRLTPAPGIVALVAVMLAVLMLGIVQLQKGRSTSARRFAWLSSVILWIAWGGMTADWQSAVHCRHPVVLRGNRPIVCFGDSVTSQGSFGAYPRDLRELVSLPVVDLGIGGISTAQALDHLPDLKRHNPQVVVIELGGHDFLRCGLLPGYSRAATKANLLTIIDTAREIGAEVVLMEIPRAYMSDPFWGLEREIARREDVELIPDTAMRTIFLRSPMFPPGSWLGGPYLADETGIHPNAEGNKILAATVAEALERMYGRAIRSPRTP